VELDVRNILCVVLRVVLVGTDAAEARVREDVLRGSWPAGLVHIAGDAVPGHLVEARLGGLLLGRSLVRPGGGEGAALRVRVLRLALGTELERLVWIVLALLRGGFFHLERREAFVRRFEGEIGRAEGHRSFRSGGL